MTPSRPSHLDSLFYYIPVVLGRRYSRVLWPRMKSRVILCGKQVHRVSKGRQTTRLGMGELRHMATSTERGV